MIYIKFRKPNQTTVVCPIPAGSNYSKLMDWGEEALRLGFCDSYQFLQGETEESAQPASRVFRRKSNG